MRESKLAATLPPACLLHWISGHSLVTLTAWSSYTSPPPLKYTIDATIASFAL